MTLGEKLQQVRRAAGLSQEQLAEMLGVSRQAVSKWETDQSSPDLDNIRALCAAFGLSADELLGVGPAPRAAGCADRLEDYTRANFRRRCFTAGWVTALLGAMLLILAFFSLFLLKDVAIRQALNTGGGWYEDAMMYAREAPMPAVFAVAGLMTAVGATLAALSAASGGRRK